MLELHIENTELTDAVVPISWCIDEDTANLFSECKKPHIVFIVCPEITDPDVDSRSKEHRYVFPLKDGMAYIELKHPGKNNIYAFITSAFSMEEISNNILEYSPSYKEYSIQYLSYNGDQWCDVLPETEEDFFKKSYYTSFKFESQRDCISVTVPDNVFAPEPSGWEKAWVNYFFKGKPGDQCDFRRRRILAYTLQPLWFLFKVLITLIATLASLSYLSKKFSIKPLIHPMSYDLSDINEIFGTSLLCLNIPDPTTEPVEDVKSYFKWVWWIIKSTGPLVFTPLALVIFFLAYRAHLYFILFLPIIILGGIFLLLLCMVGIYHAYNVNNLFGSILDWIGSKFYLKNSNIDDVICRGQPMPFKVKDLPPHRRSFSLKFQELKSKVCKPFRG